MKRTRRAPLSAAVVLGLVLPVGVAVASPAPAALTAPAPHGAVALSERVAYTLTGADCDAVEVAPVLVLADGAVPVRGDATGGCSGVVVVPDEAALAEAGATEADVRGVVLAASVGDEVVAQTPLRLKRLQAEHLEQVDGSFADVPDGVRIDGATGTLSLGTVDLTRLHSLSFTYAVPVDGSMLCNPSGYDGPHCVAGTVTVTAGRAGPVVAVGDLLHGKDGWERIVAPLLATPSGTQELFARFDPVPPAHCGPVTTPTSPVGRCSDGEPLVLLDSVDLNGRGVAELYERPADPEGAVTLFDGSLEGWKASGFAQVPGAFTVDGDELVVRGWMGNLYHEREFGDFELRLDFKVDRTTTNSGVFVRFDEPPAHDPFEATLATGYSVQIQDYGFNYPGSRDYGQTGAIYQAQAADRIATQDIGEWNSYAIRVVGQEYTVTLNGHEVTRYTGSKNLTGLIGLESHDPSGEVRFRDVRVIPLS